MAKQDMGKSMGNRECEWIRPRIPLWVDKGDGTGRPAAQVEGGDLSARELRHIERHLANCATCREYRVSMVQALAALEAAATQLPLHAEAPSLWPVLERMIASRQADVCLNGPGAGRILDNRSDQPWGDLDEVRPLRQAWTHDSIRETMAERNRTESDRRWKSRLILKVSVAAAVVVGLVEISIASRQWKDADATIHANAAPLADPVPLQTAIVSLPVEISEGDNNDTPLNQVAEAEPPRIAETTAASALDAAAAPKSPPNTRFGFDLEHGTPMPPESRDAKPVY